MFGYGVIKYIVLLEMIGAASWPRLIPVENVQATFRLATLEAFMLAPAAARLFA